MCVFIPELELFQTSYLCRSPAASAWLPSQLLALVYFTHPELGYRLVVCGLLSGGASGIPGQSLIFAKNVLYIKQHLGFQNNLALRINLPAGPMASTTKHPKQQQACSAAGYRV